MQEGSSDDHQPETSRQGSSPRKQSLDKLVVHEGSCNDQQTSRQYSSSREQSSGSLQNVTARSDNNWRHDQQQDFHQVTISQGILSGRLMADQNGDNIYAFQGIPYGKPPVDSLRFKAPEPADGWEGVKEATSDAITCVQHSISPTGQEDCLYLNVYTPELPIESMKLKPVMVWIHGGGFSTGSGSTTVYGPEYLLTEDIVLVTINYRLGIFGGFSIDDASLGVTGNPGMKDQLLALKWVQKNIKSFGGDPDNVTLFGESAGSRSVHLHMMSHKSAGYFHKAIGQSGVSITDFMNRADRNNGIQLAALLGIQTDNVRDMLTTLQALPVNTIVTAALILSNRISHFHLPTIEIQTEDAFITQNPIDIIKTGQYNQVPYLVGANDAEGLAMQLATRIATGQNITIENFLRVIPVDLQIDPESDTAEYVSERIRQFYYGDEQPSQANFAPTVNLLSDFTYIFPAYRAASEQVKTSLNPIYFYLFTADTRINLLKHLDVTTSTFPGASHADELAYMFYNSRAPGGIDEGTVEYKAIRRIVELWTNFAKYDDPTPDSSQEVIWESISEDQFKYLEFGSEESIMKNGIPLEERMQFWSEIYEEFYSERK